MSDKQEFGKFNRMHRARSEIYHTSTAGSIRKNFRNNFLNKLKTNRSRSVDRLRQIVEDYGDLISYRSITDLRRCLEADVEANSLINTSEINSLLNDIENELSQIDLQDEGDQHVIQTEIETEDIINRHLTNCKICETLNSDGDLCANCKLGLQNEFEK